MPLEKTVVKVEALDSDSGSNGLVQYMLINESNTPFTINSKTGEVVVSGSFYVLFCITLSTSINNKGTRLPKIEKFGIKALIFYSVYLKFTVCFFFFFCYR